nr:MAG TPA: hypothetical protein [Caudoviricetes sp.]
MVYNIRDRRSCIRIFYLLFILCHSARTSVV